MKAKRLVAHSHRGVEIGTASDAPLAIQVVSISKLLWLRVAFGVLLWNTHKSSKCSQNTISLGVLQVFGGV